MARSIPIFIILILLCGFSEASEYDSDRNLKLREADILLPSLLQKSKVSQQEYVADNLINIADTYFRYEEYTKAHLCYWEYFLKSSRFNINSRPYAKYALRQRAISSYYLGNYEDAIQEFKDFRGILDEDNVLEDILAHCIMSEIYIRQHNYVNAWLGVNAIKKMIDENSINNPYILALSTYVELDLIVKTEPEKANVLFDRLNFDDLTIDIQTVWLIIDSYRLLGNYLMRMGEFEEAIHPFQESIRLMEQYELTKSIGYFESYRDLMLTSSLNGNNIESIATKLNQISLDCIHSYFIYLSDEQRANYWSNYNDWFRFYLPRMACNQPESSLPRLAYNGLLISKGLLLQSYISFNEYILKSGDDEMCEILNQCNLLKQKINDLRDDNSEEARQKIFNSSTNLGRLQFRLQSNNDFKGAINIDINVDSIAKSLNPDEIAIEFFGLPHTIEKDSIFNVTEYFALTLKSDYDRPHLTRICDSRDLPTKREGVDINLYKCIWQNLENELIDVNKIYFSPDKELYYIPIEYAETHDGKMISEKFQIYRLSSTKEIATKRKLRKSELKDITIFGNIDYDNSNKNYATKTSVEYVQNNTKLYSKTMDIKRGASDYSVKIYPHLDASKPEIYSIASLSTSKGLVVTIFEEDNATETAFRSMSGNSSDILMISTHGFFEPEINEQPNDGINNKVLQEDAILAHSGLVFAGANTTLLDEDGQSLKSSENGLVTSQELSLLNLKNTNLAILSACETGLGVAADDGVLGLQRGLKKAGVQSILMSLWNVNDYTTSFLIQTFFSKYMESKSKLTAINHAIKELKKLDNEKWNNPVYWSPFILLDAIE